MDVDSDARCRRRADVDHRIVLGSPPRHREGGRESARSHGSRRPGRAAVCATLLGFAILPAQAPADDQASKTNGSASQDTSPARFDKNLGLKGWNIPFPSYGDTLLQDVGGFRSALAKFGIGFIEYNLIVVAANALNTPRSNQGVQVYWGQKLSALSSSFAYLTLDMGHFGLRGGQLQLSAGLIRSSWEPFIPNSFSFQRLAYYQTLLENKVELLVGYLPNSAGFVGTVLGGNLANPFGPSVSIPFELGMSFLTAPAPALDVKINIPPNFYNRFTIQRSLPPTPDTFIDNARLNPTGLRFLLPDARLLLVDEVGYRREAEPAASYGWIRLGVMYNNSRYADFSRPGKTAANSGFYLLADWQISRFDPSSTATAYRGLYLGGSAMYAMPQTNAVTQYYEVRAYIAGPFFSRGQDQIGLVYFHQVFSQYLLAATNLSAGFSGSFARSASNTISQSYTFKILSGLYVTEALSYTDHPSFVFFPGEGSALNLQGSLYIVF